MSFPVLRIPRGILFTVIPNPFPDSHFKVGKQNISHWLTPRHVEKQIKWSDRYPSHSHSSQQTWAVTPFHLYDSAVTGWFPLQVSTYLSSQIDSRAFDSPPAKTDLYDSLIASSSSNLRVRRIHNYSCQITFRLEESHPLKRRAAVSVCFAVPKEHWTTLQVEGQCSTKQAFLVTGEAHFPNQTERLHPAENAGRRCVKIPPDTLGERL